MIDQIRSAELLVKTALASKEILENIKKDPEETLKSLETQVVKDLPRVMENDKWIYRMVVGCLSLVVLLAVLGSIILTLMSGELKADIPDIITALGSAAIGALAGILAPSPDPHK